MAQQKIIRTPSLKKMQKDLKVAQMKKQFGNVKDLSAYKKHVFKG